ncbi:MFS transporter [Prevotella sp. KH2C16]|uniref:MFS transporter n=1 Tax=Prevotella sp. KH2C16 TaxID=1855325 RepID=UPI0008EDA617|nr:MFS transporter [Prevotella sp. KH2C16]SFG59002.1 maltose/moltooligosaccharide transporter [Prevotella sp. KH2C16]
MNKQKPDMKFWGLWNLSFGFFGVQIAYALQSANVSRIFATLGADPHSLSYFWVLPPLMGIIVQPIVGTLSDRTWTRFGRRIPYLFIGAALAVLVMCLLPNAGSFGLAVGAAMIFGLIALMFLDTSLNMAMQPFKMLVGDMVNEKQKAKAYSIQSFLCNAGSVVGFIFPFLFTWLGIQNVAAVGEVPDSVKWSFYMGAAILILCVIYTVAKVREWKPREYAEYNELTNDDFEDDIKAWYEQKWQNSSLLKLLLLRFKFTYWLENMMGNNWIVKYFKFLNSWVYLLFHAPSTFWKVGLVQFFCWAGMLYMWNYTPGAIAEIVWNTTDASSAAFQEAGNWVGILYAVQAMGSVVWAALLPSFKNTKVAYSVSLAIGGIGFAMVPFLHNPYTQFIAFLLIGCAWAAMLAMPFTFVTNALQGYGHMGAYLGLFNGTICLPQIIAALLGGIVLYLVGSHQSTMMIVAGVLFLCGALAVTFIKAEKA